MAENRPWLKFYGVVPETLEYPRISLYEAVRSSAGQRPDATAVDFLGSTLTYRELIEAIRPLLGCTRVGRTRGRRSDHDLDADLPPGVIAFYAAGKLGAVAR